jgi:hypothetical protein
MGLVPFMGAVNPELQKQAVDVAEGLAAKKTPASAGQVVHVVAPEASFTRFSRIVNVQQKRAQTQHWEDKSTK